MASRKEQKEQLRREREEREAAAKSAERRRQMIGYGAGLALVVVALVIGVVLLAGGDDDGGGGRSADSNVLPDGGEVPSQRVEDLDKAAEAAGCEVSSSRARSRDHTEDPNEQITYPANPPTSGKHFAGPADDGAYEVAPDVKELVHTLEHGRVIVWFKESLPEEARANLQAFFDEDDYHMVLVPNETNMPFDVAATAWTIDPQPNGTGRMLGCREYSPEVFDALRTFRDEHRDNGPENVP
jgi:Protein of unknown function (DUF3105)